MVTLAEICSECGDPIDTPPIPDSPQYDKFRGRCLACAVRLIIKTNVPVVPRTRLFAVADVEPVEVDVCALLLLACQRVLDEVPSTCAVGEVGPIITWGSLDALRRAVDVATEAWST